ncbi:FAD-binding oxidoreductase [Bradyrhizobium sp. Arg816]|uniref:NAD(P)/FAD-dependent oxidoreductase n=1 Tax=Bradyrhizobium sp. Arg816 TaxID=2998491 RepID=UPI00249F3894|nr:FAD-dependent oxidoreductase [Bradyrhizobium sp. Arg816]MDI3564440.1 FAD-dependent oxidoreductase [Bradyrhizobium sp. Arg816]
MTDALVLGAGMAGVSAALMLQRRGWSVALIDRQAPGRATSFGNAGIIQSEAVEPFAMPRDLRSLWKIILGNTNDVHWRLRHLGPHVGPLLSYWWHSGGSRYRQAVEVHSALVARAAEAHAPLIAAAGAESLVRRDGFRVLHRTERGMDQEAAVAERFRADYGVPYRVLSAAALAKAEPGPEQPGSA